MSLDNLDQVDAVGIDHDSGEVVLTIADYWDWANEQQHLLALQQKLNAYFHFIESGQIFDSYPQARGRTLTIDIVGRYVFPQVAEHFLAQASRVAEQLEVKIGTRHFPGSVGSEP